MINFFKKFYWIFIAVFIVIVDQITKYFISGNLDLREEITVIPGFFSITKIHNDGIALGMLSGFGGVAKIVVAVLTFVMIVVAILAIVKKWVRGPIATVCISFIIGGGIGNLIDRVVLRYVVDFLAFTFWGWDFAVFNVADIFVTVGTFLFVVYFLFFDKSSDATIDIADGKQDI